MQEQRTPTTKKWIGTWPANCDFCKAPLSDEPTFVDGRTFFGPWALMCPYCHDFRGIGIGVGKGQVYNSKTLEKIGG